MKKSKERWLKIVVSTEPRANSGPLVAATVRALESRIRPKHLYYARYSSYTDAGAMDSKYEVSLLTAVHERKIKDFFRKLSTVRKVEIEFRDSGSVAHAMAYQAVKNISPFSKDAADDNDFLDVLHWMCNMRGLDYLREARLYGYGATRILHLKALELDALRDRMIAAQNQVSNLASKALNKELYSEKIIRGQEKPQSSAKASDRVHGRKRTKSSSSVSGKGPKKQGFPRAGSAPR